MGLFMSGRKLKAAAGSMPQFIPVVRTMFQVVVDDDVSESILVMLYLQAAKDVFGRDFSRQLAPRLRQRLKHTTIERLEEALPRMREAIAARDRAEDDLLPPGATQSRYEHHLRSVIRTLLAETGQDADDAELVRDSFIAVESAIERLSAHMTGIKRQNRFLMSR